jgi:hypothetical protein
LTDNIYEYSIALCEEQEIQGREFGLLGGILQFMATYADVPIERHQVILEHIRLVNEFLIKERGKE